MNSEFVFKLAFGLMFLTFGVLMFYFQRQARQGRESWRARVQVHNENEVPILLVLRTLFGLPWYVGILLWLFVPRWIGWASLPLPPALRWSGIGVAALAVWLIAWSHRTLRAELGADLNPLLRLQPVPRLVTDGPYRWVRHPMYLAFLLMMVATALLSVNGLMGEPRRCAIGGAGILLILSVILFRTAEEERRLVEQFGHAYQDYSRRTGRFLPRLARSH